MKRAICVAALVGALSVPSIANSKVKISGPGESFMTLGTRLQVRNVTTDSDFVTDENDFRVQRARLQVGAHITKSLNLFMQTEASDQTPGSGTDLRLMSAWFLYKPLEQLQFIVGQHITGGSGRNGFASSGTYLTMDLYNIAFKGMNLGTRASGGQFTTIIPQTDAGLRTDVAPRDRGVTLFGTHSFTDQLHIKYYGSVNDGARSAQGFDEGPRWMGRVQFNYGDAEKAIFPKGTYLGNLDTVGLAVSFDRQADVAVDNATGDEVDYTFWTVDAFVEQNLGPGTLNVEAAYMDLDLDSARGQLSGTKGIGGAPLVPNAATGKQAQGDGFYASVGYLWNGFQPWFAYERWDSDGANDVGSFDGFRVGLNYYVTDNYDFVLKAGYSVDYLDWDATSGGSTDDRIEAFTFGIYTDF
jgi:hypothetical protein